MTKRVLQNSALSPGSIVTLFLNYYLSSYYIKLKLHFEARHGFCPQRAQSSLLPLLLWILFQIAEAAQTKAKQSPTPRSISTEHRSWKDHSVMPS